MSIFSNLVPIPPTLTAQSRAYDLKSRLDWGEPALTVIDARDRDAFNACHIRGAISMPMAELVDRALMSLELMRDIYVHGESDEATAEAAEALRAAGFQNVSELRGGLVGWKAVGYPVEEGVIA